MVNLFRQFTNWPGVLIGAVGRLHPIFVMVLLWLSLAIGLSAPVQAQVNDASINAIRMSTAGDKTRVWIEISEQVEFKIFQLENPPRLVVDFDSLQWNVDRGNLITQHGAVSAVRFGQNSPTVSRLVLDLVEPTDFTHSMFNAPHAAADHRLVIELGNAGSEGGFVPTPTVVQPVSPRQYITLDSGEALPFPVTRPSTVPAMPASFRDRFTIVVDAGHGGKDPGAIGRGGVYEKNVTLAAALALEQQLSATGRFNVILTRNTDTFIPLRDRPRIGRDAAGDLFISLHADSAERTSLSGASVYTLSETASDKESAALAARENASDEVGGVEISDYPEDIRNILLDLSMRRTLNEGNRFAEIVVDSLRQNWRVLPSRPHRSAGFAVLSSADMPSVLIEMGYLTNSSDVRMLESATERQRFVSSLADAITQYFDSLGGAI